ncbi:MAG: hypothetical protein ACYDAI_01125 [Trichloromonadaceae bacterium]
MAGKQAKGKTQKNSPQLERAIREGMIAMRDSEKGKIGWILLWLLGIPIPVLLVLFFLRGCT